MWVRVPPGVLLERKEMNKGDERWVRDDQEFKDVGFPDGEYAAIAERNVVVISNNGKSRQIYIERLWKKLK